MYTEHFGLQKELFEDVIAQDSDVFLGARQRLVAANLTIALTRRDSVAILHGPPGVGKTTIASQSLRNMATRLALGWIGSVPLSAHELLEQLLTEFGFSPYRNSRTERLQIWRQFLSEMSITDTRVCVLVENAQEFDPEVLRALESLTARDPNGCPGANIVLTSSAPLRELLNSPLLAALKQRTRMQAVLTPFTVEETRDYLEHKIKVAGGTNLFGEGAIETLHQYSQGVPRVINNLCESALTVAAARHETALSGAIVKRVAEGLFGMDPGPIDRTAAMPPAAAQEPGPVAAQPAAAIQPAAPPPSAPMPAAPATAADPLSSAPPAKLPQRPPTEAPPRPQIVTSPSAPHPAELKPAPDFPASAGAAQSTSVESFGPARPAPPSTAAESPEPASEPTAAHVEPAPRTAPQPAFTPSAQAPAPTPAPPKPAAKPATVNDEPTAEPLDLDSSMITAAPIPSEEPLNLDSSMITARPATIDLDSSMIGPAPPPSYDSSSSAIEEIQLSEVEIDDVLGTALLEDFGDGSPETEASLEVEEWSSGAKQSIDVPTLTDSVELENNGVLDLDPTDNSPAPSADELFHSLEISDIVDTEELAEADAITPEDSGELHALEAFANAKVLEDISNSMAETLFGDAELDQLAATLAVATEKQAKNSDEELDDEPLPARGNSAR